MENEEQVEELEALIEGGEAEIKDKAQKIMQLESNLEALTRSHLKLEGKIEAYEKVLCGTEDDD